MPRARRALNSTKPSAYIESIYRTEKMALKLLRSSADRKEKLQTDRQTDLQGNSDKLQTKLGIGNTVEPLNYTVFF